MHRKLQSQLVEYINLSINLISGEQRATPVGIKVYYYG